MTGSLAAWLPVLGAAIATGAVVALAMPPLIGWLKRRAVWDVPNDRSSHREITPRGGGIAVTGAILAALAVLQMRATDPLGTLLVLGAAALALVSWLDDRRGGLPVALRLAAQAASVGFVLAFLPSFLTVTGGFVPVWLERVVLFLAWIWFTNLFNFMDGINGITGVEMVSVGAGAVLVAALGGHDFAVAPGLVIAGAAFGFLPWNWGRAKVFLGDVGSVPVGYLLGGLLLALALAGQWAAALILPMYYWVDATLTLLRRLLRGEPIWRAHRSHFYQQGADGLGSHAAVAGRIAALNLVLVVLAVTSTLSPLAAIVCVAAAVALTLLLCRHFAAASKPVVS